MDNTMLRIRKFRAVVTRYFEINGRFPFAFRQAFGKDSPISNLWKYPELVLVDWETGGSPDEEMSLDETMLAFKQRLGIAPFRLHSRASCGSSRRCKPTARISIRRSRFPDGRREASWCMPRRSKTRRWPTACGA